MPFHALLPELTIHQAIEELQIKYRRRLFDPFVMLWAFLSEVLDVDKSCHNAVSWVIAYLVSEGVEIPSPDTSAYCGARARLPEKLLENLFGKAAQNLEEKVIPFSFIGETFELLKLYDGNGFIILNLKAKI